MIPQTGGAGVPSDICNVRVDGLWWLRSSTLCQEGCITCCPEDRK